MSETIVRCPMCPNHCDVRTLRCIRGRQWQMRQRAKAMSQSVPVEKQQNEEEKNQKQS